MWVNQVALLLGLSMPNLSVHLLSSSVLSFFVLFVSSLAQIPSYIRLSFLQMLSFCTSGSGCTHIMKRTTDCHRHSRPFLHIIQKWELTCDLKNFLWPLDSAQFPVHELEEKGCTLWWKLWSLSLTPTPSSVHLTIGVLTAPLKSDRTEASCAQVMVQPHTWVRGNRCGRTSSWWSKCLRDGVSPQIVHIFILIVRFSKKASGIFAHLGTMAAVLSTCSCHCKSICLVWSVI